MSRKNCIIVYTYLESDAVHTPVARKNRHCEQYPNACRCTEKSTVHHVTVPFILFIYFLPPPVRSPPPGRSRSSPYSASGQNSGIPIGLTCIIRTVPLPGLVRHLHIRRHLFLGNIRHHPGHPADAPLESGMNEYVQAVIELSQDMVSVPSDDDTAFLVRQPRIASF